LAIEAVVVMLVISTLTSMSSVSIATVYHQTACPVKVSADNINYCNEENLQWPEICSHVAITE